MATYKICPECAYAIESEQGNVCPACRCELLPSCPFCRHPFGVPTSIYCAQCGEKLRISYVPIQ